MSVFRETVPFAGSPTGRDCCIAVIDDVHRAATFALARSSRSSHSGKAAGAGPSRYLEARAGRDLAGLLFRINSSPRLNLVSALQLHTDSSAGTQRYAVQENGVLSGHEFQPIAYDEPIRA